MNVLKSIEEIVNGTRKGSGTFSPHWHFLRCDVTSKKMRSKNVLSNTAPQDREQRT
jgi:hypothetical protein